MSEFTMICERCKSPSDGPVCRLCTKPVILQGLNQSRAQLERQLNNKEACVIAAEQLLSKVKK